MSSAGWPPFLSDCVPVGYRHLTNLTIHLQFVASQKAINMADRWYYASDQQKLGPFSAVQLKQLAVLKTLRPDHMVWKNDMDKGVVAARVINLFVNSQATAPRPGAITAVAPEPVAPVRPPEVPAASIPNVENGTAESSSVLTAPADPTGPTRPAIPNRNQSPEKKPDKKRRATAVKGAVIVSQDGDSAKYRKKCTKCCHEDANTRTMPIKNGTVRMHYHCSKCRKNGEVIIHGH
jgi:hypothetical protein